MADTDSISELWNAISPASTRKPFYGSGKVKTVLTLHPDPQAQRSNLEQLDDHRADVMECLKKIHAIGDHGAERHYQYLQRVLACADLPMASVPDGTDEALPERWAAYLALWPPDTDRKHKVSEWLTESDPAERIDRVCEGLLQDGRDVREAWDLVRYRLSQEHPGNDFKKAERFVNIRVLFVGKENLPGYIGTLTLEWLPDPDGAVLASPLRFSRHPAMLLMPCDADVLSALENSLAWAQKQPWARQGAVRWNITLETGELDGFKGNSLGGAFAVGLGLLFSEDEEQGDRSIAITAAVLRNGSFAKVGGVIEKLLTALDQATLHPIHKVILARAELSSAEEVQIADDNNRREERIYRASNAEEALALFRREMLPLRQLRTAIHKQTGTFKLATGSDKEYAGEQSLFIPLSLLQEIKVVELPERDERDRTENDGRNKDNMEAESPRRWEEMEAAFRTARTSQSLPKEIDKFYQEGNGTRWVIVGPPGCGKSTLVQYLAWRMTDPKQPLELQTRQVTPDPKQPFELQTRQVTPVFLRLRDWEVSYPDAALPTVLHERIDPQLPVATWTMLFNQNQIFLILDGLDEVSSTFAGKIQEALKPYRQTPTLITCRSVSRERLKDAGFENDVSVYTPQPLTLDQQRTYVTNYIAQVAQHKEPLNPEKLVQEMNKQSLQLLASNPLLLTILCYVADSLKGAPLPETRTLVYKAAVGKMYEQMHGSTRQRVHYLTELDPTRKQTALGRLALELFAQGERKLIFPHHQVLRVLETFCMELGFQKAVADSLIKDLRVNSLLLMGRELGDYAFLHLTFQEYLAAATLADYLESVGFPAVGDWDKEKWQTTFERIDRAIEDKQAGRTPQLDPPLSRLEEYIGFLDRKAWLPEWREVFLFLAGSLEDPVPLLDLLSDYKGVTRDDYTRSRMELAALCMAEIPLEA